MNVVQYIHQNWIINRYNVKVALRQELNKIAFSFMNLNLKFKSISCSEHII